MVRYKRSRRGRRNSTNVIKMKIQSFMDISTSDTSMQVITVSAGGKSLIERLSAQFSAYKYFKVGNIAVKLVPASTLPCDPTGLSYEAGEQTVDPRDQLTPGMMRITNGEDVFEDITGLTDDQQHGIYNNMLLDPRWFKWMLQSGVKRHASPRYWQIGQLHQDKWPGAIYNFPVVSALGEVTGTAHRDMSDITGTGFGETGHVGSSPYGFFQTGHRGVLGWLPTDGFQPVRTTASSDPVEKPFFAAVPEVEVMKIILPKAYKTKYYYRMFITETVYFKEPLVTFGVLDGGYTYRPLDVFHAAPWSALYPPSSARSGQYGPGEDGGNYGDD